MSSAYNHSGLELYRAPRKLGRKQESHPNFVRVKPDTKSDRWPYSRVREEVKVEYSQASEETWKPYRMLDLYGKHRRCVRARARRQWVALF